VGVEVLLHLFLTLGLEGGQWSAYRPSCLIPLPTHTIEGWVDVLERKKLATATDQLSDGAATVPTELPLHTGCGKDGD
jgi:hypothetical protein